MDLIIGTTILLVLVGWFYWLYVNNVWKCSVCGTAFKKDCGYPPLDTMAGDLGAICIPCHKLTYENYNTKESNDSVS